MLMCSSDMPKLQESKLELPLFKIFFRHFLTVQVQTVYVCACIRVFCLYVFLCVCLYLCNYTVFLTILGVTYENDERKNSAVN